MSTYWLKRSPNGPVEGPFDAATIRVMSTDGRLPADVLISADQVKWGRLRQPAAAQAPVPPTPAAVTTPHHAPAPAPIRSPVVAAAPVIPLAYSSGEETGAVGKQRNLQWLMMTAIAAIFSAGIALAIYFLAVHGLEFGNVYAFVEPSMGALIVFGLVVALTLALSLVIGIYWLVWVYKIHTEMSRFTSEAYPISPGKALGFCFIPFFNLFWLVYMPYRLAKELGVRLGQKHAKSASVLTLMTLAIFPGIFIPALGTLFQVIATSKIQSGLNLLWKRHSSPTSTQKPSDAAAALSAMSGM